MSWEDKDLKKNYKGEMVPQAYDPDIDDYAVVKSIMGALRFVPYGPDGQPLNVSGGKLQIRSAELEALMQGFATEGKLEEVRAILALIESKDFATDAELKLLKGLLSDIEQKDFATQTTLAATLAKLEAVESKLDNLETVLTDGSQKVQQSGSIGELSPSLFADRPAASLANKGKTHWSIDTGEVAVSTGTAWRKIGVA